jgi:hypothetical protein
MISLGVGMLRSAAGSLIHARYVPKQAGTVWVRKLVLGKARTVGYEQMKIRYEKKSSPMI